MKSLFLHIISCFISLSCVGQTFDLLISTPLNDYCWSAVETENGEFIIPIYETSVFGETPVQQELKLFKINKHGAIIDSIIFNSPDYYYGFTPITHDNYIYLFGSTRPKNSQISKPALLKLDFNFNVSFLKIYDGVIPEGGINECIFNQVGNLLCNGHTKSSFGEMFFWELDLDGNILKNSGLTPGYTASSKIMEIPHLDVYQIIQNQQINTIWIREIERSTLNFTNNELFTPSTSDYPTVRDAKQLTDSTYMLFGTFETIYSLQKWDYDVGYKIYDQNMLDLKTIKFTRPDTNDQSASMDFITRDSIFLGFTKNWDLDHDLHFKKQDHWYGLYNVKEDGTVNWQRYYGGDANYFLTKVLATRDGGALIIGERWDYRNNPVKEKDLYIIKVDREGNFEPKAGLGVKDNFFSRQVLIYPNPAQDILNIQTGLLNDLSLQIYDMQGKMLIDKKLNYSSEQIDISQFKQGLYFYFLSNSKGFKESGKILKQ
jgi:hypothetical protein